MSNKADAVAEVGEKIKEAIIDETETEVNVEEETPKKLAERKLKGKMKMTEPAEDDTGKIPEAEEQKKAPEMVILRSGDGEEFMVKMAAVKASSTIQNIIDDGCLDGCVPLPNVMSDVLVYVIEYLNHHIGSSEEEMSDLKDWNLKFCQRDTTDDLFDIMIAAHYLEVKPLQDITCQTVANMIKDMTVEEVREFFQIEADHDPEEEAKLRQDNAWAFE